MKLTFKEKETDGKFKEFVCENKAVLKTLCEFLQLVKNPFLRIAFNALSKIIDVACPEKKTN